MTRRIEVYTGDKIGRLTFIGDAPTKSNRRHCIFLCDCGNTTISALYDVRNGHTRSCGCYHNEIRRKIRLTHGATADRKSTPEYRAWKAMKGRCFDPNNISYKNYGARGVTVCDQWLNDYPAFLKEIGRRPSKNHSVDRINNNGNYEPGNVRWATRKEQRRNSDRIHPVTINGITKIICDWAAVSGVPEESISARIRHGWEYERAVFYPVNHRC
jgi:hypothetical protein